MVDDPDTSTNDQQDAQDDSWNAFVAGDFEDVLEASDLAATGDGDDEWRVRNPFHHIADMYVSRYGNVAGRSSPAEFWWGSLLFLVVTLAMAFSLRFHPVVKMVLIGWAILASIAVVTAAIRRLHDTDRGQAKVRFTLVSAIYLLTAGSDPKPNDYGDPRVKYTGPLGNRLYRRHSDS